MGQRFRRRPAVTLITVIVESSREPKNSGYAGGLTHGPTSLWHHLELGRNEILSKGFI